MLRRIAILALCGTLALSLAGCVTQTQLDDTQQKLAEAVQVVCGFVPVADSLSPIIDILGLSAGASAKTLTAAAKVVCDSLNKKGLRRGLVAGEYMVTVRDQKGHAFTVPIKGHFAK